MKGDRLYPNAWARSRFSYAVRDSAASDLFGDGLLGLVFWGTGRF